MIQEFNANTLAQIAINEIEENDIVNILSEMYENMPAIDPEDPEGENKDYDRYFAANRLSHVNKSLLDKYKKIVYELMKSPKGYDIRRYFSVRQMHSICLFCRICKLL